MTVSNTSKNTRSYLDYLATTPMDPRVLDSMLPFFTTHFGNSSSRTHEYGWNSEAALNKARLQIANLINASPSELIFTSGATESNNLALIGLSRMHEKPHFITLQTEHKAVLDPLRLLEASGCIEATYLPVDKNGQLNTALIKNHIKPNTVCISIMGINNEIGVVQDLKEIGRIAKENNLVFHCDAAQAVGKMNLDVNEMNIGLLSISGHKIYGPKGIGALYIRKKPRVRIQSLTNGGGQERGLRSGTVPVALAVGLGKAAEIAQNEMDRDYKKVHAMSNYLKERFTNEIGDVVFNGHSMQLNDKGIDASIPNKNQSINQNEPKDQKWYPGCLNVSFAYVEGEGLLMALKDIALSSGSACTSASLEPSYVLRALGTDEDLAHSSIRFGIGRFTTWKEIKSVADKLVSVVKKLRDMSPLWEMVKEGVDLKTIKWSAE